MAAIPALNYPITGPPKPSPAPADGKATLLCTVHFAKFSGSVPLRREIRDLQHNFPDQWTLYILGLQAFQQLDEKSDLSWYGIAGIHGRPYRPWGGVQGDNPAGWQGYCTHSSILFAPWHRPYLALFEQYLYQIIQKIAATFPTFTKARYQQAALTFRMPYWDWAAAPPAGDKYFPTVVGQPLIQIITPTSNNKPVQINNPLYSYKFNPLNPLKGDFPSAPESRWPTTLRYPTSGSATAKSQEQQVFDAMQSQFDSYQSNVYLIMRDPNYKQFDAFSNHQWASNNAPGTYGSIEDVHNSVHSETGGNGQMGDPDYAAFDPLFWLHHTNVDRQFAIWQALNPNSYAINKPSGDGTFSIQSGSQETSTTPLTPFNNATGKTYWTSEGVRSTATFNYAYPETQQWKYSTAQQYQTSVLVAVQTLYGATSNQFMQLMGVQTAAAPEQSSTQAENIVAGSSNAAQKPIGNGAASSSDGHNFLSNLLHSSAKAKPKPGDAIRGGEDFESEIGKPSEAPAAAEPIKYREYICNIRAPKHILHQTYRVRIFLGDFNSDPATWATEQSTIGTFSSFGKNPETTGCGKCIKDEARSLMISGTVPLTPILLKLYKNGDLGSFEVENVIPYLRQNLHWRVTLADGTEIDRGDVEGLKISVVSTEVRCAQGGFPEYSGEYEVHSEVTGGRPAGLGEGDRI
ncbi:putative tyrosinase precursor protein [Botrytis cinerea BcDW1]|uniref:tyrosinase n=1 Tax=Botryotinia fuckeliana (strain BcDW1) TaxID=1290391 RepID=M7UHP1_BOTF1|nr:putative tyrosinase precursor protein [Botrytis cinerea BcDW1]